ncbi:PIN domain-containing protein [bacterium]|nr:PIN domain-containing protein [bacterium]
MRVSEALKPFQSVFLDTAPLIYYLEGNPIYGERMAQFMATREALGIALVTSPVTLAECLVHPMRLGLPDLAEGYLRLIVGGAATRFQSLGRAEGLQAAQLRARHGLKLADALQVAAAMSAGCDAIITNDLTLKRLDGIAVLLLDDLEP